MISKLRGDERIEAGSIIVIARQELLLSARSAWTLVFAVIFGVLVTAIAYFGLMAEGFSGVQGFTRTAASLLNLVLYIIPLVALTMGVMSFTGDDSTLELLFSQPVLRVEVLLGKLLGLFFSLALSTIIGFGVAGSFIAVQSGSAGILGYLAFVGFSLLLGLVFLCLSALLSALARRRTRAIGLAIFLWFFFAIFYDLLVIAAATLTRGPTASTVLFVSLFGNPVDMVRVASLIALDGVTIFGAAGVALLRWLGGKLGSLAVTFVLFAFWISTPLYLSYLVLRRQDV